MTLKKRSDVSFLLKVLTLFFLLALGIWKNQHQPIEAARTRDLPYVAPTADPSADFADLTYGEVTLTSGSSSAAPE